MNAPDNQNSAPAATGFTHEKVETNNLLMIVLILLVAAGAEFLLSGAFIVRPQRLQAWAAATAGISARTERPVITVIQTFQAMTSMPVRKHRPPSRRIR